MKGQRNVRDGLQESLLFLVSLPNLWIHLLLDMASYDYEKMGVKRYQVAGLLQVGNEKGPVAGEFGFEEQVPNATVQIRGQSSSRSKQKSYKIEIK